MDPLDGNDDDVVRIDLPQLRQNYAGEAPQPVDVLAQPVTMQTLIEQYFSPALLEEMRSDLRQVTATYEDSGSVTIYPQQLIALLMSGPERNAFIEAISVKDVKGVRLSFRQQGAPFKSLENHILDLVHHGRWTAEDVADPFTSLAKGLGGVKSLMFLAVFDLSPAFVPAFASFVRECQQITNLIYRNFGLNASAPIETTFQSYLLLCLLDHPSIEHIRFPVTAYSIQEVCSTLATLPSLRFCSLRGPYQYDDASAVRIISDGATEALCELLSSPEISDVGIERIYLGMESAERVSNALVTSSIDILDFDGVLSGDNVVPLLRNSHQWKIENLTIHLGKWNATIEKCLSSYVHSNKHIARFDLDLSNSQVTTFQSDSLLAAIDCPARGHVRLSVGPPRSVDGDWKQRLEHVLAMNETREALKSLFDKIENEKLAVLHSSYLGQALLGMNRSMLFDFLRRNERDLQDLVRRLWPQDNDDDEQQKDDNLDGVVRPNRKRPASSISSDK
jgi:hypothetical protein